MDTLYRHYFYRVSGYLALGEGDLPGKNLPDYEGRKPFPGIQAG
jgi:hypothetical protein